MLFVGKSAQQLTEADLITLIGVARENEAIDFKEAPYPQPPENQLPSDQRERERIKNEWKISLCTDITALANANGGWIMCGMKEEGGVASEICGIGSQIDTEREIARLGQVVTTGVEPSISGLEFGVIRLQDPVKSVVIAIRVPRSFRSPHRVKASRKFHVRRSGRNDEMNIDELRSMFNLSDTITEQIKKFHANRIAAISVGDHEDLPAILNDGVRMVLHLVPLSISDPSSRITFQSFAFAQKAFADSGNSSWAAYMEHNLDGVVLPSRTDENGKQRRYFQIFRNGACEHVEVLRIDEANMLPLGWIEAYARENLEYLMKFQNNLGIEPPSVAILSLVGVRGYRMKPAIQEIWGSASDPSPNLISKQNLILPDIVVENLAADPKMVLKPIFDIMWNAGGWKGSLNYDKNGDFIVRKQR